MSSSQPVAEPGRYRLAAKREARALPLPSFNVPSALEAVAAQCTPFASFLKVASHSNPANSHATLGNQSDAFNALKSAIASQRVSVSLVDELVPYLLSLLELQNCRELNKTVLGVVAASCSIPDSSVGLDAWHRWLALRTDGSKPDAMREPTLQIFGFLAEEKIFRDVLLLKCSQQLLGRILDLFVGYLEALLASGLSGSGATAPQPTVRLSEQLVVALKVIGHVLPAVEPSTNTDRRRPSRVIDACRGVLACGVATREAVTGCGIQLGATLPMVAEAAAGTSEVERTACAIRDLLSSDNSWFASVASVPRLAVLRGVLVGCPLASMLSSASAGNAPLGSPTILEGPLLHMITVECCHSDNQVRLYAFQALETWIGTAARACASSATSSSSSSSSSPAGSAVSPAALAVIVDLTLANWSHPYKRLSSMMADVFDHMLTLLDAMGGATDNTAASGTTSLSAVTLLQLVVAQPVAQVARYAALARMLRRIGSAAMLSAHPLLVQEVFAAASAASDVGTIAGGFLTSLLAGARQDIEANQFGLPCGTGGGASMAWQRGAAPASAEDDAETPPAQPSVNSKAKAKRARAGRNAIRTSNRAVVLQAITSAGPSLVGLLSSPSPASIADVKSAVTSAVACGSLDPSLALDAEVELLHRQAYTRWCEVWLPHLAPHLLHPLRDVRTRCMQYCMRDIVSMDEATGRLIADAVSSYSPPRAASATSTIGDDLLSLDERKAWAVMAVAAAQRVAGWRVLEGEVEEGQRPVVTWADLARWSVSPDVESRLVALDVSCVTQSSVHAPSTQELELAINWLQGNTKTSSIDHRKRVNRAVSALLDRIVSSANHLARDGSPDALAQLSPLLDRSCSFLRALVTLCLACLHPGASPDRTALPLDLLQLAVGKVGPGAFDGASSAAGATAARAKALIAPRLMGSVGDMASESTVVALLNLFTAASDRTRTAAFNLLCRVSPGSPLPGYTSPATVRPLIGWALSLTESPRDRESATGALLLRLVHTRYCACLGWSITVGPASVDSTGGERVVVALPGAVEQPSLAQPPASSSSLAFLASLVQLVSVRMTAFSSALHHLFGIDTGVGISDGVGQQHDDRQTPLAHGLVTAIRLIISDLDVQAISAREAGIAGAAPWRSLISTTLATVRRAQVLALHVVAGRDETDGDAGGPEAQAKASPRAASGDGEQVLTTKGRVDCRPGAIGNGRPKALTMPVSNSVTSLKKGQPMPDLHAAARDRPSAPVNQAKRESGQHHTPSQAEIVADAQRLASGAIEDEASAAAVMADGGDDAAELAVDGEGGGEQDLAHMLVVASWLLTRECVALQGDMVSRLPLPATNGSAAGTGAHVDDESASWLISTRDVTDSGALLLRSLLTLRHIGSIHAAGEALQQVCTRLLLIGGASPHLAALPGKWLDSLLARLQGSGSGAQFILRRSAGFSQAFVSILRSEPRNDAPILLRRCMVVLLQLAGADAALLHADLAGIVAAGAAALGGSEDIEKAGPGTDTGVPDASSSAPASWRTAVHALNILRLLYRDASLGEDVSGFVPTALRTALAGFRSRAWAIRNSSMMLYAAVADRAIGTQGRNVQDHGPTGGVGGKARDKDRPSVSQFFSRYPSLQAFILAELQAGAANVGQLSPTTFPLLLLLARMRPVFASAVQAGDAVGAEFQPAILACSGQSHIFVRRVAARALLSCLAPGQAPALIRKYATLLPVCLGGEAHGALDDNVTHGLLLQIVALVAAATASGGRAGDRSPVIISLLNQLSGPLADASSSRSVGCLVHAAAVDVVRGAAALTSDRTASLALSSVFNTGLARPASGDLRASLGHVLLVEVCADSLVTSALVSIIRSADADADDALRHISTALTHDNEDARVAAAKSVKRCVKHADRHAADDDGVEVHGSLGQADAAAPPRQRLMCSTSGQRLLGVLLSRLTPGVGFEDHPGVRSRLLQAVHLLLQDVPSSTSSAAVHLARKGDAVAALMACHDHAYHPKARGTALLILGRLVSVMPHGDDEFGDNGLAGEFVKRVLPATSDLASFALRHAATRALASSGLLSVALAASASSSLRTACVPLWPAVFKLLVDFDDEAREAARAGVVIAVQPWLGPALAVLPQLFGSLPASLIPLLPSQASLTAAPLPVPNIDEATATVLAYASLVATASVSPASPVSACISTMLAGQVMGVVGQHGLASAAGAAADAVAQSRGPAKPTQDGHLPFATTMLRRPMFLPDPDNEYAEQLVTGGLAAAAWRCIANSACVDPAALAEVAQSCSQLTEVCSSADISLFAEPVLGGQYPWVAPEGVDHCPDVFAAARVAEAALR